MQRNLTARLFTKIAAIAIIVAVAVSCDKDPVPGQNQENKPTPSQKETFAIKPVEQMSLTEKIGQMFFLRVETLAGSTTPAKSITQAMAEEFAKFPCGGFTLFADNITTPAQLYEIVHNCHKLGNYPLISIDEEGGRVARIGKNKNFDVPHYESMLSVGNTGNEANAFDAGKSIGNYLASYDIDIDLAPVADVFTNPANTVIGDRAFSTDPVIAGNMSSQFLLGLKSKHVEGCLKHFPGHGDTSTDTHTGYAESLKTWEQMLECEMIPFKKGIEKGAKMIMTAHIAAPNVTGDNLPATLSKVIITDKLRGELGFDGIVVTDAIEMGAITNHYTVEESTINAVLAGVDIILLPTHYEDAFNALLDAVSKGTITEERITQSARRIVELKKSILRERGLLAE